MTTIPEPPEFAELRKCEEHLQTVEYAALTQEEKEAFLIRYRHAAAKAREAAGRHER